jgi:hypothetical protein
VVHGDGQTVDEQFARLSRSKQRALEENGLGLPELRRIAAEDGGERRVRHILSEYDPSSSWWDFDGDRWSEDSAAVWPWIRLLLVAVAGVIVCLLSTYLINKEALFVGAACGLAVLWALFRTRLSRGGLVARCLTGAAYVVLIWAGSQSADEWYLQVRGQETAVTYAKPKYSESHGVSSPYCRVKLPDGSVREVFQNDKRCVDHLGSKATAVIDPAGHYRPVLGHKEDIGGGFSDYLCLGAAAVLVLAPLTAVALGRANEARSGRGGRLNGTAA